MQTLKTSVHGAINMLGLAKRIKAKIFQASTSEVYGDPHVQSDGNVLNTRRDREPVMAMISSASSRTLKRHVKF